MTEIGTRREWAIEIALGAALSQPMLCRLYFAERERAEAAYEVIKADLAAHTGNRESSKEYADDFGTITLRLDNIISTGLRHSGEIQRIECADSVAYEAKRAFAVAVAQKDAA